LKALREVFSNLIDNALKYTVGKDLQAGLEQSHLQGIAISDTGPGPPEDLEHIFEHYRGVQSFGDSWNRVGVGDCQRLDRANAG